MLPRRLHGNGCQILLSHERSLRGQPDLLGCCGKKFCRGLAHVVLDPDKVIVKMERAKNVSTLEVDIELPNGVEGLREAG